MALNMDFASSTGVLLKHITCGPHIPRKCTSLLLTCCQTSHGTFLMLDVALGEIIGSDGLRKSCWEVLVAVHFLVLVSPGPNFLIVTQTAVRYNRAAGIAASFGIASGVLVWSTCASLGLDALFTNFPWLHGILKVFGGVYLAYVGFYVVAIRRQAIDANRRFNATPRTGKSYRLGLLTNLTNPKAAIFFGSVFTALLPPDAPTWARVAAIGIVVTKLFCSFHALFGSLPIN